MTEGYTQIPHSTYDEWRNATMGHSYDVDGAFGCQCWDYTAELWYNVGFGTGYPHTGQNLCAYECWTVSRNANAGDKFDLIYNLNDVKRGDVIVLDQGRYSWDTTGHIAFADEDYNGSGQLSMVGQNQVNPSATTGSPVAVSTLSVAKFLGAFRLKEWHQTPPTPPTPYPISEKSGHFPFVLYANKLRNGL